MSGTEAPLGSFSEHNYGIYVNGFDTGNESSQHRMKKKKALASIAEVRA